VIAINADAWNGKNKDEDIKMDNYDAKVDQDDGASTLEVLGSSNRNSQVVHLNEEGSLALPAFYATDYEAYSRLWN